MAAYYWLNSQQPSSASSTRQYRQELTLNWAMQNSREFNGDEQYQQSVAKSNTDESESNRVKTNDDSGCLAELQDEDACSLVDSQAWHENDLILAAELGKALLERNRELERQVSQLQANCQEQNQEIELLTKQLCTLRSLNDSKMKIYEDVDKHCAEVEQQNRLLVAEREQLKQRCSTLTVTNSALEIRVDELKQQIGNERDAVAAAAASAAAAAAATAVTTVEAATGADYKEALAVHPELSVEEVESQLTCQQQRPRQQEVDDDEQQQQQQRQQQMLLHEEIDRLEQELCRQTSIATELRHQLHQHQQQHQQQRVCQRCCLSESRSSDSDLLSTIESDFSHIQGVADCGQLTGGCQIFSSEENLVRLGASRLLNPEKTLNEVSLLSELNEQYNRLVVEYEQLLAGKRAKPINSNQQQQQQQQQQQHSIFEHKLNAIFSDEARAERKQLVNQDYRPKYKTLFREARAKLKEMRSGE